MLPIKDNIPGEGFPVVTVGLILANVVVYILSIQHGGNFFSGPSAGQVIKYGSIPFALTHCLSGQVAGGHCVSGSMPGGISTWQTAFTAMFMHASIIHIGGNLLFLWIFGNNVEDALGHLKYLGFYILGGLAALALQVAVAPDSAAPTLGASGAIAAVLGGYILLYPRARVLTLVIIIFFVTMIELPALLVLGLWFVQQAVFGATNLVTPTGSSGGVAYFAHIGGFGYGLLTIKLVAARRRQLPPPAVAH